MSSPVVDSAQREAFLHDAEDLGFHREEFGFVGSSGVEGNAIRHYAIISRGNRRWKYPHGGQLRWLHDALGDLKRGQFGAPKGAIEWAAAVHPDSGPMRGKWLPDGYITFGLETFDFPGPMKVYDTEAEALAPVREWIADLKARRSK